jgi:hypothetical protein
VWLIPFGLWPMIIGRRNLICQDKTCLSATSSTNKFHKNCLEIQAWPSLWEPFGWPSVIKCVEKNAPRAAHSRFSDKKMFLSFL